MMQDGPGEKPIAATPETGLKPSAISGCNKLTMHFIGRDIAGLRQNIDFQPQKVGGQRIGFAHKD